MAYKYPTFETQQENPDAQQACRSFDSPLYSTHTHVLFLRATAWMQPRIRAAAAFRAGAMLFALAVVLIIFLLGLKELLETGVWSRNAIQAIAGISWVCNGFIIRNWISTRCNFCAIS